MRRFWDDRALRTKVLGVVAVPVVPLLVSAVLILATTARQREAEQWVTHTLQVKAQIASTMALTADANAAVETFLLTRRREDLVPFVELGKQYPDKLRTLVQLVRDNPEQVARLKEMAALQGRNPFVTLVQYGAAHADAPVPPALLTEKEHDIQTFRDILSRMQDVEDGLLQTRLAARRAAARQQETFTLAGVALATAATLFVAVIFSAGFVRRIYGIRDNAARLSRGEELAPIEHGRRDEIGQLACAIADASKLLKAREGELNEHVAELAAVNHELEAFSYSVSHDLRAPLRHITGFASLLESTSAGHLGSEDHRRLKTISEAATRMGRLIDDLLSFSRMGRQAIAKRRVRLDEVLEEARRDVATDGSPSAAWTIHPLPEVDADPAMLHLVFVNLLSNALKYARPGEPPAVEIGANGHKPGETVVFVKDNGVGFDMQYAHKLFGVFQRLHSSDQFEGTGIGLANVRRIIHRHGGRTWAEGAVNAGATFYFSLPTGEART